MDEAARINTLAKTNDHAHVTYALRFSVVVHISLTLRLLSAGVMATEGMVCV